MTIACGPASCGGSQGSATASELVIELAPNGDGADLVVYVEDRSLNTLATADGQATVLLQCFGSDGETVLSERQPWPFTDTDGGTAPPHVHEPVDASAGRIVRCQLTGTKGPLAGGPRLPR